MIRKTLVALGLALSIVSASAQINVPIGPSGGAGGGGSGSVTSIATSCGISGGTITSTGTLSAIATPETQTGANYPFVTGDCGKLKILSNASNQIPTIPQAGTTGFATGWFTEACNQGAGTQTITPTTSTIGGAATYVLAAGTAAAPKCIGIVSDGTNYQLDMTGVGGGGAPSGAAGGDLGGTYPNPSLSFSTASAAAAAADADTFPTNQGAGTLKQTLAAIKTWIKAWITPTDAGLFKTYVASRYYAPYGVPIGGSSAATAANRVHFFPFMVPQKITISELFIRVSSGSAGNWQGAIYAADASTLMPTGTVLAKSNASVSTAATGDIQSVLAANYQLIPGALYWMGFNTDGAIATFPAVNTTGGLLTAANIIGNATMSNVIIGGTTLGSGYYVDSISLGTWGDMTSATFVALTVGPVLVGFKVASVP